MLAQALQEPDLAYEALHALEERLGALDAASGVLVWRSAGFAEALPGLPLGAPVASVADADGLFEAVAACGDRPTTAVISAGRPPGGT